MPVAVPAFFIEDHWWPHSSIRERAATLREAESTSGADVPDDAGRAFPDDG